MKRFLCTILVLLLFSLSACGTKTEITGIWEQEMSISILGVEGESTAASIARFTFREDGSGSQEQIFHDNSHPDTVREFHWQLEGNTLVLDYGENRKEEFTVSVSKSSLKLENRRGSYDLTKSE